MDFRIGADGVKIGRVEDHSVRVEKWVLGRCAGVVGLQGTEVRFTQFEPVLLGTEARHDERDSDLIGDAVLQHEITEQVEFQLVLSRYEIHGNVVVDEAQRFARVLRQLVQKVGRHFAEFQAVALLAVEVVDALRVQSVWRPVSTVESSFKGQKNVG